VSKPLELEGYSALSLASTNEDGYCRAARGMRDNEFWWYYNGLVQRRGFFKPFQAADGRWWFYVKPFFAWPVDYFAPMTNGHARAPRPMLAGWQYPVADEAAGNSLVWLNVIQDLSDYDISKVAANKRRAVRKGFRNLAIEVVDPSNEGLAREACEVWNSHVERTGWNTPMAADDFVRSWRELARWPGTTVVTARAVENRAEMCAWLIARTIDRTVYVDTIASHTDRLAHRPNDAIIFACLASASGMGIKHAHYSLKSRLESLEAFKESLGFVAHPFPAQLHLRWPIGPGLRTFSPGNYKRLLGDPVWVEEATRPRVLGFVARATPRQPAKSTSPAEFVESIGKQWGPEAKEVARSWYIPEKPPVRPDWIVYSLDFVLATLQGQITEPQNVRRTVPWLIAGTVVRAIMAVVQVVVILFAHIPVASWVLEMLARTFTRNGAGFFLRSCYWKARLKRLGTDTIIDQGVEIWGPANVSIGSNCHIDTNVRLAAGERRHKQRGSIEIGDFVHLGPGVHIAGRGGVRIGDYVGISSNAHLYSATGTIERPADPGQLVGMSHMAPRDHQHTIEKPIVIEPYSFIGMMTRILPGVRIGFGAVVHANCELTRDVPAFANIGGVARGRQIGWRRPRRKSPNLKTFAEKSAHGESASEITPEERGTVGPKDGGAARRVNRLSEAEGTGD